MDIHFCDAGGEAIMDLSADVVPLVGDRVSLRGARTPDDPAWHRFTAYSVTSRRFRHEGRTLVAVVAIAPVE